MPGLLGPCGGNCRAWPVRRPSLGPLGCLVGTWPSVAPRLEGKTQKPSALTRSWEGGQRGFNVGRGGGGTLSAGRDPGAAKVVCTLCCRQSGGSGRVSADGVTKRHGKALLPERRVLMESGDWGLELRPLIRRTQGAMLPAAMEEEEAPRDEVVVAWEEDTT